VTLTRHVVATVDEIAPGTSKVVEVNGRAVGIFNVNGEFFALLNRCPHAGAELCRGNIETRIRKFDIKVEPGETLVKGPYKAETFAVSVEQNYLVIEA
jgi:nitrite reductase/ring-hydroxylating ferredoxin subunit